MRKAVLPVLILLGVAAYLFLTPLHSAATAAPGKVSPPAPGNQVATFAGGCFWCMEPPFEELKGVVSVTSGYTGGRKERPTYEEVSEGGTGHRESVNVVFDPRQVSFAQLLEVYWHNIDPLNNAGQFCDYGEQYRSAIFYHDDAQRRLAEESKAALEKSRKWRIVTDILPASTFWPAEEYHQDYHRKNPLRYKFYRFNCGRDARLEELWTTQ